MSFPTARLGDLVAILSGFAFDAANFSDEGDIALIRIRDVVRGQSSTFYRGNYDEKYLVQQGDVLIGMDGEFNRARWKSAPALLNQRVCKIASSSPNLSDEYLFHFLPSALKAIEDTTSFVTVKHLSAKQIKDISIPLPPVEEQRRIAAILDQAETLRTQRRTALALLDSLTQSLFLDMFGAGESNGWPITSIEEIVDEENGGIRTGPFGSQLLHSEFVDEGVAVLGIDNAVNNEFRWSERRYITHAKYEELKRYTVRPGDVLITIMGTCGRCAVVPDDIPLAINTKHLCCISVDRRRVVPGYLHAYFLRHPTARKYLEQKAKGAIMSGLNMGIIKAMPIALPPLPLQQTFATRIASIEALKATHRRALAALDALFASLQQRAFTGAL